jgi:hypothetical protein
MFIQRIARLSSEKKKKISEKKPCTRAAMGVLYWQMKPTFKHSPDTQEGRIERSVYILRDPRGFMADKQDFLLSKGVTTSEFLTALNIASNGELLQVAMKQVNRPRYSTARQL